jgi:hypothetical protein
MPPKIWVPQPASRGYAAGGGDPVTIRDQLVNQYGEGTVTRAEIQTMLDVIMISGLIKPHEFFDVMQKRLYHLDQMRRAAANLDEDRG